MDATAVILEAPEALSLRPLPLVPIGPADVRVAIEWSGISSGTEKLLWAGRMPNFPGMGYPLVPGYESVGRIVDAGSDARARIGEWVFVPGANCFQGARGLFGGAASSVVIPAARAIPIRETLERDGILLALAATAFHAIEVGGVPELVIGHGILGRLIARIAIASGGTAPTVWETDVARRDAFDYTVIDPAADDRRDYASICDASGASDVLDLAFARIAKRGSVTLAGFYDHLAFAFPPAFMREARLNISAEFTPADVEGVLALIDADLLDLTGLITHARPAADAADAYPQAFTDTACLKMVLDWRTI